jgi:hypothetical protein
VLLGLVLAERLESTQAGVICLTPENLTKPWLLFEAGALSKLHKQARVCTYLIGMSYAEVPPGPFSHFQHTFATKEDTYRMVQSIHRAIPEGERRLTEPELERAFKRCWPELWQCLQALPDPEEPLPPPRKTEDLLEEILLAVRQSHDLIFRSTMAIRHSQITKRFEDLQDALRRLNAGEEGPQAPV